MNNDTHVNFSIFNFTENLDEITKIMGCAPTQAWMKGESYNIENRSTKRTHSRWVLSSGLNLTESIERQLVSLLTILETQVKGLDKIIQNYESGIIVAAYYHETNPGFSLPTQIIKRMSALGVSIDFDLYCLGDTIE